MKSRFALPALAVALLGASYLLKGISMPSLPGAGSEQSSSAPASLAPLNVGYHWAAGDFSALDFRLTASLKSEEDEPSPLGGSAASFEFEGIFNLRVLRVEADHILLAALISPVVAKVAGELDANLAALIDRNICVIDLSPDGAVLATRFSEEMSEGQCEIVRGLYDFSFVLHRGQNRWQVEEATHSGKFRSAYSALDGRIHKVRTSVPLSETQTENVTLRRSSWTGTVGRVWLSSLEVSEDGLEQVGEKVVGVSSFEASFHERDGAAIPNLLATFTEAKAEDFISDPTKHIPSHAAIEHYANRPLDEFFLPLKEAVLADRPRSGMITEVARWVRFNQPHGAAEVAELLRTEEDKFLTADLACALGLSNSQEELIAIITDPRGATDDAIRQAYDALGTTSTWNPQAAAALATTATSGDSPELMSKARLSWGEYVASQPNFQQQFMDQAALWIADPQADVRENGWRSLANSRIETQRETAEIAFTKESSVEGKRAIIDYIGNLPVSATSEVLLTGAARDPEDGIAIPAIEALARTQHGPATATVTGVLEAASRSASPNRAEKAQATLKAIRTQSAK